MRRRTAYLPNSTNVSAIQPAWLTATTQVLRLALRSLRSRKGQAKDARERNGLRPVTTTRLSEVLGSWQHDGLMAETRSRDEQFR
jgi:hypothetical protein